MNVFKLNANSENVKGISQNSFNVGESSKYITEISDEINIDTLRAITFNPQEIGGRFGNSVSDAGDLNGDGFDDIAIGNESFDKVFIYHGSVNGLPYTASKVLTGINAHTFYEGFGEVVSNAGDVNSDGFDDFKKNKIVIFT